VEDASAGSICRRARGRAAGDDREDRRAHSSRDFARSRSRSPRASTSPGARLRRAPAIARARVAAPLALVRSPDRARRAGEARERSRSTILRLRAFHLLQTASRNTTDPTSAPARAVCTARPIAGTSSGTSSSSTRSSTAGCR
jgi:hypothetical protein